MPRNYRVAHTKKELDLLALQRELVRMLTNYRERFGKFIPFTDEELDVILSSPPKKRRTMKYAKRLNISSRLRKFKRQFGIDLLA